MTEGQQAGVAEQQVEAERRDRHHESVGEQDRLVLVEDVGQGEEHERDGRREGEHPGGGADVERNRNGTHARPKSPAGRTSSTAAAMR